MVIGNDGFVGNMILKIVTLNAVHVGALKSVFAYGACKR